MIDLETLSQEHRQYMLNLFDIRRKTIRDVMVPWEQVVSVSLSNSENQVATIIHTSGHTRLPVIGNGRVIGILHTKEFMALHTTGAKDWERIIRPTIQLRETDSLIQGLKLMQERHSHLSIVFASTVPIGIVTMEDIFEEIIGDIFDEDDDGRLKRILTTSRRDRLAQWVKKEQESLNTRHPAPSSVFKPNKTKTDH